MNLWKPIDFLADYMRHTLGPQAQLRMGVLMFLMGVVLTAYLPLSDEPPIIYIMSAAALVFAGIGVIVSAETLIEVAEDVDDVSEGVDEVSDDVDTLTEICKTCGRGPDEK